MTLRFTMFFVAFVAFVLNLSAQTATSPTLGDGTSGSPYEIATLENLYWLSQTSTEWDKHYIQVADIDASETENWDEGAGFLPIGNATYYFTGSYDGKGFGIIGLTINRPDSLMVGLFGYLHSSIIKNIKLFDAKITGGQRTAILAGNCYLATVDSCSVHGVVNSNSYFVGGIAGLGNYTTFSYCSAEGEVNAVNITGGFIGKNSGDISYSYSNCDVSGTSNLGGFAGYSETNSTITNSYCDGSVNSTSTGVGGFVGGFWNGVVINNCYTLATVFSTSSSEIGGFAGSDYGGTGVITNSFWNSDVYATDNGFGTPKTTVELQTQSTYTDAGWDFIGETINGSDDIWGFGLCSDYPSLTWQPGTVIKGNGTVDDPYHISSLCELRWLSENDSLWDDNFIQTTNIYAEETNTWNVGDHDGNGGTPDEPMGFSPIGETVTPFSGSYKGQGHTISNLFINRPTGHFIAMFGYLSGSNALIDSLGITNANISGNDRVAVLVGASNNWCEINNCFVEGTVTGNNNYVGGFVGSASAVSLNNSYSMVDVTGADYVGGFVGQNGNNPTLTNCYCVGNVTATGTNVGGFVGGESTGDIYSSFWNVNMDGDAVSLSGDDNFGATGLSTYEMTGMCDYNDAAWDFMNESLNGTEDIWGMNYAENGGYPFLSWQGYSHTEVLCGCSPPTGSGTDLDPYQIASICDLKWLSDNSAAWNKYYIQTADIDASVTSTWDNGQGFIPIGNNSTRFTGTYNGQGHTIDALFINRSSTDFIGLFGYINTGALVDSLGLTNVDITGNQYTGGFVGYNNLSTIDHSYINGEILGYDFVGGIVGRNSGDVINCFNEASVSGNNRVGGIVGDNYTSVTKSYNIGDISGTRDVGGIIGNNPGGFVSDIYNTGNITASQNAGGVIGTNYVSAELMNSYSIGTVVAGSSFGGLVGYNDNNSIVSNSFYNIDSIATSPAGTGLTTIEMQQMCVYADSTWDFQNEIINGAQNVWGLNPAENGGYPFLSWQGYTHTETCCGYEAPVGAGTEGDPYQISSLCDLAWVANNTSIWGSNLHYTQTADIDATETSTWYVGDHDDDAGTPDEAMGFQPIGFNGIFKGNYNGKGYTVSNLYINRPTSSNVGFFGHFDWSRVDSLGLINVNITGGQRTGALAGMINDVSTVNECYTTGVVSGYTYTGGIVGQINTVDGTVLNSYSMCDVMGDLVQVGSLVGFSNGLIENSYAIGTADQGLSAYVGGSAVVSNSFYNLDNTATAIVGTGLTTAEMQQMCVYVDSTWDIMLENVNGVEDIWGLNANENGGYPFLSWQGFEQTESCCGYLDLIDPDLPSLDNVTGECNATATAPTTTDNCAGTITGTTSDPLEYTEQGTYTITWTFDDGNGNVITADQNVIIDDVTDPELPSLIDIIGECSATATAPTTTDNCVGTITGTTADPLEYTEQGTFTITWSFDDGHGNVATVDQSVIVDDITAPDMLTLDTLTAECSVTASAPTTEDNCSGTITATTSDALEYTGQGTFTITWTFDDGNDNFIEVDQVVVVDDLTNPAITCVANQEVDADDTHTYQVTGTEFDPSEVTDNCEVVSLVNDFNSTETLANVQLPEGTTTITWTVTDGAGNISTCSYDVVVNEYVGLNSGLAGSFNIYPNPSNGKFYVEMSALNVERISITDITGKVVMVKQNPDPNEIIELSGVDQGIYLIYLQTNEGIYKSKLIKK